MKDPARLLEGDATAMERELLSAGAAEQPPADGAQRLAAALGISAAAVLGSQAATGSAQASAGASGLNGGAAAKLALKWLLLATGGVVLVTASFVMRDGRTETEDSQGPYVPDQYVPDEPQAPAAGGLPDTDETAATPSAPAEPPAAADPAPRPEPRRHTPSVGREIALLDAARAGLQRGDANAALALLAAYRREHPSGVLKQEAALLRIEALVKDGDRDGALRHAQRFLRDHPASPHEQRIRELTASKPDAR